MVHFKFNAKQGSMSRFFFFFPSLCTVEYMIRITNEVQYDTFSSDFKIGLANSLIIHLFYSPFERHTEVCGNHTNKTLGRLLMNSFINARQTNKRVILITEPNFLC